MARTAGISEQTLYNYFPTKEHLVFDQTETVEAALRDMIVNRPAGAGLLGGVRSGVLRFLGDATAAPSPGGMPRLVAVSPALRRSWLDLADRLAGSLAQTLITESRGTLPGPTARILAGTIMSIFTTMVLELGAADPTRPRVVDELRQAVNLALDHLERGLADL